jgi:hypothetical protein
MTFLPIVTRELRVASRKRSTYWVRSGAGLVVVGLGTWLFLVMQEQNSPRDLALWLFYVLAGSALLYALVSGLRTTADCLSEEKREDTLGLLFLTDLRGYDVVLGKLMANSVNALYAVLAILPMLAIPLLMGGVTAGEYVRMALLALNALFFSLAAGMWVSALSRSGYHAMLGTSLVILGFTALVPALGFLLQLLGRTRNLAELFLVPSAVYAYWGALDQVYRTTPEHFLKSMGIIHFFGWFFLILASIIVPRSWQERPRSAQRQRWGERFRAWSYGDFSERKAFRTRLLNKNAFFWLASRARIKPGLVWGFLGLVACAWVCGLARAGRDWLESGIYMSTGIALNVALRCWLAAEVTRQIADDRKSSTLELLLSTPLSVEEILQGQLLALTRQFLGPVLVILGVECLFMAGSVSDAGDTSRGVIWIYTAGMMMFVLDLAAIYWVGMWQGISAKNHSRALSTTLARILILPWVVIALVLLGLALLSMGGINPPDPSTEVIVGLWFVTGALIDIGFGAVARHQLLTRFRLAAQERYGARAGFWKWLLGNS